MAYKMAYEVVVCKKQNGPCNEKTTRFLDCNFKSDLLCNNSYASMAYKMAYEVVVCKKQNGPCNEKTTRFLDCNFKSDHLFYVF